jgi:predicted DNA-binding protein
MIRSQFYLTTNIKKHIELFAKREQKPEAQVIRELLEVGIRQKEHHQETSGNALLRLAKIGGKGPTDASTRIDDYLYGDAE